jgi:hypothetical protein
VFCICGTSKASVALNISNNRIWHDGKISKHSSISLIPYLSSSKKSQRGEILATLPYTWVMAHHHRIERAPLGNVKVDQIKPILQSFAKCVVNIYT